MKLQSEKWVYSTNEELFSSDEYDSKEEAIKAAKEDYTWEDQCPTFYVGQVQEVDFHLDVDVDAILERIAVLVSEEVGEVADNYLDDVTAEHAEQLNDELNEVVQKWMNQHQYNPTFYSVIHIEKVESE